MITVRPLSRRTSLPCGGCGSWPLETATPIWTTTSRPPTGQTTCWCWRRTGRSDPWPPGSTPIFAFLAGGCTGRPTSTPEKPLPRHATPAALLADAGAPGARTVRRTAGAPSAGHPPHHLSGLRPGLSDWLLPAVRRRAVSGAHRTGKRAALPGAGGQWIGGHQRAAGPEGGQGDFPERDARPAPRRCLGGPGPVQGRAPAGAQVWYAQVAGPGAGAGLGLGRRGLPGPGV